MVHLWRSMVLGIGPSHAFLYLKTSQIAKWEKEKKKDIRANKKKVEDSKEGKIR